MKIYSFDTNSIKFNNITKLFDIFQKNIEYNNEIQLFVYFVPREYEMRLDLVSKKLYGTNNYVEELMVINNIINPYSIKENQKIYYCTKDALETLYVKDNLSNNDDIREEIIKNSQPSKNRNVTKQKTPTTVKPKNLKQVTIDTKNRKIKIMNTFK